MLQFKEAEGHCRVSYRFKLDGFNLGQWVSKQRTNQDSLSPERKQRLDDIGFVWDPLAEVWEEGFSKMLQFKEAEGHCRVHNLFKLEGYNLGSWVNVQRRIKDSMSAERKQRLDDLGFVWDANTEAWEVGFSKLIQFKELKGHCKVPASSKLDGYGLGAWVRKQRIAKDSMSAERQKRLDDIGFIWAVRKDKT